MIRLLLALIALLPLHLRKDKRKGHSKSRAAAISNGNRRKKRR